MYQHPLVMSDFESIFLFSHLPDDIRRDITYYHKKVMGFMSHPTEQHNFVRIQAHGVELPLEMRIKSLKGIKIGSSKKDLAILLIRASLSTIESIITPETVIFPYSIMLRTNDMGTQLTLRVGID